MKTKMFFVIAVLALLLPFGAAQAQETKPDDSSSARAGGNITIENLVGKYSGVYVSDFVFSRGVTLVILHAKGSEVQGTFTAYQKNCSGEAAMRGKLNEQKILEIAVDAVDLAGCEARKITVSVSEDGNKLVGEILGAGGRTAKIQFSR